MSTATTTSSAQQQEVSVLFLRGRAEVAIREHSAHQQAPAPSSNTARLRADREYPAPYEGPSPDWWPQGADVPPYRPLNREVDFSSRPWAATPAEVSFVRGMLSGVLVIGYANRAWRSTFGRVTDKVWRYPVGGEF